MARTAFAFRESPAIRIFFISCSPLQAAPEAGYYATATAFLQDVFSDRRPALFELMRDAHQRRFDVVVVTAFDRFGRSLRYLIDTLEEFHTLGIDFVSVRHQIDTTTPAGKMTFAVISAMAEFERELISERVRAGMKKARERGERIGRPPLPERLVQEVVMLHKAGASHAQAAERLGISRGSAAGIWRRWRSRNGNGNDGPEPPENRGS